MPAALALLLGATARAQAPASPTVPDCGSAIPAGRVVVLFDSVNCKYSPAARAALAAAVDGNAEVRACAVSMDTADGQAAASALGVASSPTLLFLDGSEEAWRAVAPADAERTRKLVADVLSGARTWTSQQDGLSHAALPASEALDLAAAAREAGRAPLAHAALAYVAGGGGAPNPEQLRAASLELASEGDGSHVAALRRHLRRHPDDADAAARLARELMKDGDVKTAQAAIARASDLVASRPDRYPAPFVAGVHGLAYQLVANRGPAFACWALPLVRRAMQAEPREGWHLQDTVALARLCGRDDVVDEALRAFGRAYDADAMQDDTRRRYDVFVQELLRDTADAAQGILASSLDGPSGGPGRSDVH